MKEIGSQVRLPLNIAFQISLQGIRIRLGRALVTLSGVVLGIAFLMSVLTGDLITKAMAGEQETRRTTEMMLNTIRADIGGVEGKTIGIAVFGTMSDAEHALVRKLLALNPKAINAAGMTRTGINTVGLDKVGQQASLVLVLGDAPQASLTLEALTAGMAGTPKVMDSVAQRFASSPVVEPIFFFGEAREADEAELAKKATQDRFRTYWIMTISLLVTVIGISNALLMSVTERFKEIGTMKCLGALSVFIRQLFVIESALIGVVGSLLGVILGALFPMITYGFTFGFAMVFSSMNYADLALFGLISLVAGTLLSIIAAIYPATFASRMVPAMALRSNV